MKIRSFCSKTLVLTFIFIVLISINAVFANTYTILRVAVEPYLPPYQFISDDKVVGLHIDLLNNIADKNNLVIEYVTYNNNTDCMNALDSNKVDAVLGVVREFNFKYYNQMTDAISQSSICAIARNDIARYIRDKSNSKFYNAVFENGTIDYSFISSMKNLNYNVVSNQTRAFDTLVSGKADLLIGNKSSILYQLEKNNLYDKYMIINNYMVPIEYSIIVKKSDQEILKKLNRGIENLKISGDYENIYDKWINEKDYLLKETIKTIFKTALIIGTIILIIFVITINFNRLLKKQVNKKTKELQKLNEDLKYQIIQTRNYNELNNCIVESSPSGIIAINKNYKINLFNQNASIVTGIEDNPLGMNLYDLKFFSDILSDKEDKIFSPEYQFLNEEIMLKGVTYRYDIIKLYNTDQSVRGAVITIEDITQEIRVKDQIYEKEKNKALNQIIAGIAHEIRNPLAAIKTFVELLPYKRDNLNFQEQIVEVVPQEVDRVSNLIKNLINYAKPDVSSRTMISVDGVIKSSIALVNNTFENAKIKLIAKISEGLVIMADDNQIKQVMVNLMLNGVDAMEEKLRKNPSISNLSMLIRSWKDNDGIYIQVSDEGTGMNNEEIRKSTNPFFTTKASGTGLGMYISRQYVEKNGGSMIIESEKNEYTKITIKFEIII